LTARITGLVELAVAAAGLAVYLAVLGGLQLWVKLEAAGLPSDAALSGYDPAVLAASGIRALAVVPLAFGLLLVLIRAPVARALSWLQIVLIQGYVVFVGVMFGLSALSVIVSLAPTDALSLSGVEDPCVRLTPTGPQIATALGAAKPSP
jgi:hypothetical protein